MSKFLVFPSIVALAIATLPTTLLVIGFNSPYTHENLVPRFDSAYSRTAEIVVGQPETNQEVSPATPLAANMSLEQRGEELFVAKGCASCHGLRGQGGTFAPPNAGSSVEKLLAKVRTGPKGMPQFSEKEVTNDDLAAISAYLVKVGKEDGTSYSK